MNRVNLRHILLAVSLGSLLTVPCAWAARETIAGRAGGAWSVDRDHLSPLWSRAVRWVSKNGPSIDPDGSFPPGTKNGLSIDPDGSTSPSSQPSSCIPGSGGCGS
jgi:hypothetical protein